jgi:hypothetical protein
LDEGRARRLLAGELEHRLALVEPDDLAAQMPRQEAGPAGDVERPHRRERSDDAEKLLELVLPAGPVAVGVRAASQPPVVVLPGARVIVGLHAS